MTSRSLILLAVLAASALLGAWLLFGASRKFTDPEPFASQGSEYGLEEPSATQAPRSAVQASEPIPDDREHQTNESFLEEYWGPEWSSVRASLPAQSFAMLEEEFTPPLPWEEVAPRFERLAKEPDRKEMLQTHSKLALVGMDRKKLEERIRRRYPDLDLTPERLDELEERGRELDVDILEAAIELTDASIEYRRRAWDEGDFQKCPIFSIAPPEPAGPRPFQHVVSGFDGGWAVSMPLDSNLDFRLADASDRLVEARNAKLSGLYEYARRWR